MCRVAGMAAVERVVMDMGIVCPQGPVHLANAQETLGAAEANARTKCDRVTSGGEIWSRRCRRSGNDF